MLQLHRSCARGAQVSTALAPPIIPPPTVMPSYILPHPPSPLPHPAIWSFSQNHVHTARIFPPPRFLSWYKNRMKGLFQSWSYRRNPLILLLSNFNCNSHIQREWQNVGHLKFKGTKATAVHLFAIVWAFSLTSEVLKRISSYFFIYFF